MEYKAITGENFYLFEMRKTCKFLNENGETENFKKLLRENNILNAISESNFSKKFFTINKRIKALTVKLKKEMANTDINTARFINLYAILSNERFILEFMDEVIKDKWEHYDYYIVKKDFVNFLNYKAEQSKKVEAWSESAKKEMLKKLKKFLLEGGYIEKDKEKNYKIFRPVVDKNVIDEIENNGNKKILKIMLY